VTADQVHLLEPPNGDAKVLESSGNALGDMVAVPGESVVAGNPLQQQQGLALSPAAELPPTGLVNAAANGLAQLSAAVLGSTIPTEGKAGGGVIGSVGNNIASPGSVTGDPKDAHVGGNITQVPRNELGVESHDQSGDVSESPLRGGTNSASIASPASGVAQVDPATFEAIRASAHSHTNPASSTRIQIPNVL